jgi:hypothetical protein
MGKLKLNAMTCLETHQCITEAKPKDVTCTPEHSNLSLPIAMKAFVLVYFKFGLRDPIKVLQM